MEQEHKRSDAEIQRILVEYREGLRKTSRRYKKVAKAARREFRKRFKDEHGRSYSAYRQTIEPVKTRARQAVWVAVRAGRLVRLPCEKCGAIKTEAHHPDYSKPLEVRWLCKRHHMEYHRHHALDRPSD